jgi:N-methylhydantoinase A/oxoprolinase/acetone carboxylase beta subunit
MYLGIDVGGTHTDAVVLDAQKRIQAWAKVPTLHHDLLSSVTQALDSVLQSVAAQDIVRLNLSTTLSTNAIVESKTEDVGVLVSSGPGIDPENFRQGGFFFPLSGSIDHRGKVIAAMEQDELAAAVRRCCDSGIRVYAAVGKFSTRNPDHEETMAHEAMQCGDFVSMGHRLSGQLSFPRRVATAYYNSAVWRLYNSFADAVESQSRRRHHAAGCFTAYARRVHSFRPCGQRYGHCGSLRYQRRRCDSGYRRDNDRYCAFCLRFSGYRK